MSDQPSGSNSPRRKGRFHSRYGGEEYRPLSISKRLPGNQPANPSDPPEEVSDGREPVPISNDTPFAENDPAYEVAPAEVGTPAAGAVATEEDDGLLPNFRLNKVYEEPPARATPLKDWRWLSLTALLLLGGLGGGYFLGLNSAPASSSSPEVAKSPAKTNVSVLTDEEQAAVDAAFASTKQGRYKEAHDQFLALREQHPQWWSLGIEAARASLYLHEPQDAQRALKLVETEAALPDSNFLTALLHLTNKELELAEKSFALAVARDPARPDFYYFWGECLRRDGKPREAADKFRSALLRNQYENSEGLYRTKLWLSEIQADREEASGVNKEIDNFLAASRPAYEALFAAAARELKRKQYSAAVGFLSRAQAITEPAVFKVVMQDPSFLEEASHPEVAPFYR